MLGLHQLELRVLFVLLRYQGYIGAALVLGGMDCNGPHLYSIYPHGSTDKLPYVTMGEYRRGLGSKLGRLTSLLA